MKLRTSASSRPCLQAWILALALTPLAGHIARAVPYASCITNTAGTVSYILNEDADNVKVLFDGLTVTNNLGGQAKGLHSFSLGAHADYAIYVSRNTPAGWTKTSADTNPLLLFNVGRGITVNAFPKDAHTFGRIYIVNSAANGGTVSNPGAGISRTLGGKGLYVLNADQSDCFGKGAAAIVNGMTQTTSTSDPWKPGWGRDDHLLYVNSFANATAGTWVMDADLTTCANAIYNVGITGGYHYDPANTPIVHGTLADGTLTLWNVEGSRPSALNKVARWDIGSGPLNGTVTPALLGWCDHRPANLGSAGLNTDIEVLDDGKIITSLNRAAGTDTASIQVFDTDGVTVLWDSLSKGGSPDPLRLTRAIALAPDGKTLAMVRDGGSVMFVTLTNGIPDLSSFNVFTNGETTLVAGGTPSGSARDIAYDAAGNLYLIGGTNNTYSLYGAKVYSPGGNTVAVTANDSTGVNGTFFVTNLIPIVTLIASTPLTSEDTNATPPAVFTFSRTGDTTYPLTVGYAIGGTAVNGTDYAALPTSVTIPAGAGSADVLVTALPDSLAEPTETVTLTLSNSVNYIKGTPLPITVWISDTNTPVLALSAISPSMYERVPSDYARLTITRNLGNTNSFVILSDPGLLTYGGTAVMGVDYVVNTNNFPIYISFGDRTNYVDLVSPIDNSLLDGTRTLIIGLVSGADYLAATNKVSANIIDDENPPETVLWSDNFDADTSAGYTVQFASANSVPDYSAAFAFDYSQYYVPSAPHSGGDTRGLLVNVNKGDSTSLGAAGVNLYPAGQSFSGDYALRFDMYLFEGSSATTEYSIFGINHDGAHANWFRSSGNGYTNSSYDGVWGIVETDASGTDDYVLFTGPTVTNSGILGPSYRARVGAGSFNQVFKSPPFAGGAAGGGSPANLSAPLSPQAPTWADVELAQVGNLVTLRINHTVVLQYNNTVAATNGNIMLGYDDSYDSIGNSLGVIYENARVVRLFPPSIVAQPTGAVTPVGGSTNFTVVASGSTTGLTSYQWRLNGVAIPGATNATLALNNVQLAHYGSYTVVVSDGLYSVTSAPASLLVLPAGVALGSGTGLRAGYWTTRTNTDPYSGSPTLTRLDSAVNFSWAAGSPDPSISADYFTARWAGQVQALSAGSDTYTFTTITDDGVRLWVNGQLIIDSWVLQGGTPRSGSITLAGTNKYNIVMEYFEQTGSASAQLYWSNATTVGYSAIPQSQFYPGASALPSVALTAPANSSTFMAPATINLTASVTTNNSVIQYVSFYNGANLLGNSYFPPYQFSWQNVPVGAYNITAAVVYSTNWVAFSGATNTVTVSSLAPVTGMSITPGAEGGYSINYAGGGGARFILLGSPNVAAPLGSWARVATNATPSGSFVIPVGADPRFFYRIQSE